MQTNTEKTLTNEQAAHLMKELSARSREPIGNHLTDYEFMAYVLDLFSPDEIKAADQHLDRCPECLDQLEFMYESEPFWNSKEAQQQQEAFFGVAPKVESIKSPVTSWSGNLLQPFKQAIADLLPSPIPVAGYAKSEIAESKIFTLPNPYNENALFCRMAYKNNCLVLRFSTDILTLGNKLTLSNNQGVMREIELAPVANELYAELILTEDEGRTILIADDFKVIWGQ